MAGVTQPRQRRDQPARTQCRFAPATDQLLQLHDEFDLADAAPAQLQVCIQRTALHFGLDHALHLAQALECTEVQIAAIDEGPQHRQETLALGQIAGHRARLDPGIALPVAAFALEILFHRRERQRQPPDLAERTQPHVHAVDHALRIDIGQQLDQALAQTLEEVAIVQRPRAIALAGLGIGEHQIDIGGKVQLGATQFAEPEHHHALRHTGAIAWHAVLGFERALHRFQRTGQTTLGQLRSTRESVFQGVDAVHIAVGQPQAFIVPVAPQPCRPAGLVFRRQLEAGAAPLKRRDAAGFSAKLFEGVVAGDQQTMQRCGRRGSHSLGCQRRQLLQPGMQQLVQGCGQIHAGDSGRSTPSAARGDAMAATAASRSSPRRRG